MKKVVLKLDFADEKIKQKAMKKVSGISGLESIALDPKDKKLTVTGDIDPVTVVAKLRKLCHTEIVSVGPAKEPEKKDDKKDEPKKEEPKKGDDKKKDGPKEEQLIKAFPAYYQPPYYYQQQNQYQPYQYPAAAVVPPAYFNRSADEDPNGCVIC